ncbi:hypothetical protein GCM10011578_029720 [Streptomyces fuscichromogenes]|uniref:Uncharacterized protein n=1 Tax=Streptomyces fuscichromogenes TaxID=1324013 RepID=A0A917XBX4_9ACTN|nr:hypothetical protein GCM10011578_029720 [Streptomyces fuscichromogenes]
MDGSRPGETVRSRVADVRFPANGGKWTRSVRWSGPDPANLAHRTITWTPEHGGRATRLLLVREVFDPGGPERLTARGIMDGGWRSHVLRRLGQTRERVE